ncbi:MAG: response regulator transcription factor [Bacteroidales bacterium]|nr:response regulator transcription factor [Bacteroidales bacterium]
MNTNPITIAIVDDHQLFRMGIKQMLAARPAMFRLILEASSSQEFLGGMEGLGAAAPDVVLLDLRLSNDECGVDLARWLRANVPETKVLVLSGESDAQLIGQLMVLGISGFVSKSASFDELALAIELVAEGGEYFGRDIARIIRDIHMARLSVSHDDFTQRENEIITMAVDGLSSKQIADKLNISIHTVNTHKNHIFRKMGINSSIEMVNFAIRHKIIDL